MSLPRCTDKGPLLGVLQMRPDPGYRWDLIGRLIFRTEFGPDYGDRRVGGMETQDRLVRSQRRGQSGRRG